MEKTEGVLIVSYCLIGKNCSPQFMLKRNNSIINVPIYHALFIPKNLYDNFWNPRKITTKKYHKWRKIYFFKTWAQDNKIFQMV